MGQKIHPTGYRVGIIEPWASRWHGNKHDFARLLLQDKKIRDHVAKEYGSAGIPRIEIERTSDAVNVIIYTARPGVLEQQPREVVLAAVPPGGPGLDDSDAVAGGVDLLSH